jgi:hypothetical protein
MRRGTAILFLCFAAILITAALLISCSGGSPNTGFVNTSISDPAPCSMPTGPYSHVFVTVTDVKIHASASAGPNDPGWMSLTPDLESNGPQQIDLLNEPLNECFLAMLGSKTELQAGNYQQVRIMLASTGNGLTKNSCDQLPGDVPNCVQLANGSQFPLLLSSEANTGLKIPSGQIAGGQFTVAAGQTKDLDIDFNTCASITLQGNGQYRLNPVLTAGEVSTNSAINGTLIDSGTKSPIAGGTAFVALEKRDLNNVDHVVLSTKADPTSGAFALCPVQNGTYDVVAAAVDSTGNIYAATVITGVPAGSVMGSIELFKTGVASASLTGNVTTSPIAEDIGLAALQPIGGGVQIVTPLALESMATATLSTSTGTCVPNSCTAMFKWAVPVAPPQVGAFNAGNPPTSGYSAAPTPNGILYMVDGEPPLLAGGTAACSQADVLSNSVAVSPGLPFGVGTLPFTNCQ